jgi:hypothetical protein
VGSGKLFGEDYGYALSEVCGIQDPSFVADIVLLCSLMRAYIVIDDFARDEGLVDSEVVVIREAELNIAKEVKRLIALLDTEPDEIWHKYTAQYEDACRRFPQLSPYAAVGAKCSLVFLPFELNAIRTSGHSVYVRKVVADYLFALQLLDDFCDMEEDQQSPLNHNLFLLRVREEDWESLTARRAHVASLLIKYISHELKEQPVRSVGRRICYQMEMSLQWLREVQEQLRNSLEIETSLVFPGDFEHFDFCAQPLLSMAPPKHLDHDILDKIRAENMHTGQL